MHSTSQSRFPVARALGIAIACSAATALADDSEKPFIKELKPSLLHASALDLYAPALEYRFAWQHRGDSTEGSLSHFFRANTEGTVATDSRANPENLFAEIEGGMNLEGTQVGTAPAPGSKGSSAGEGVKMSFDTPDAGKEPIRWGNLTLTAAARFETDQGLDNYNATFGGNLGYVHRNGDNLPVWSLLPKVQLRYHYVDVLESREFERRGIDEDSFWRLDALADWTFKIGTWIDRNYDHWYSGLALTAALKYYRGFEMPKGAEEAGLDESWFYSGGVYYRFKPESHLAHWISATYLTVGHGRIPPTTVDQTLVSLGIVLNFD